MKSPIPILAACLALTACGAPSDPGAAPAPQEPAATVRLPAVPGRPGAGYLSLNIQSDHGALVSVTSPQAGRIEMHETMSGGGQMSAMRPLARIPVRERETLRFEPGGRHLMLYDLAEDLATGDRVVLTFHFERGPPETVEAVAQPAGGAAH